MAVIGLKKIKNKSVEVDREIGEAVVTITLSGRGIKEARTRITSDDAKQIAITGGAEVLELISGQTISNRDGESTGVWKFKIPTTDPENSTSTILKRREKKKKKKQVVVEEDWNLGPEE